MLVGAVVEARHGAFIADEKGQGIGLLLENESHAALVGDVVEFLVDIVFGAGEFVFEQAGFESSHAAEAPAGQSHGLDQVLFDGVGGTVGILVGLEELQEVRFGFAGEYVGIGGQAVLEGILGRAFFAFGSLGSARLFAVLTGGVGF